MRIKSRLLKKVKIHKAKDEKVPIAWELGKEIPKLPYKQCLESEDLCEEVLKLLKFRISESDQDLWFCSGEIEAIKFEHATLQNVDFEWGTFGRPYRYRPDVRKCPGLKKRIEVKVADESLINYETVVEFETQTTEKHKAHKVSTSTGNKKESFDFLDNSELLESLSYNQQLLDCCLRNPFKLENLQFKISEEEGVCWGLELDIPDVVYEHASLQNVEFEWGTFSRPVVRQKPDIRGKEVGAPTLRHAKIETLNFEETETFTTSSTVCVANIINPHINRAFCSTLEIREDKDDISNMIYKNTKYYCKQCDYYICNGCLTNQCFNHDVQWIGNSTFICECPKHKPSDNIR